MCWALDVGVADCRSSINFSFTIPRPFICLTRAASIFIPTTGSLCHCESNRSFVDVFCLRCNSFLLISNCRCCMSFYVVCAVLCNSCTVRTLTQTHILRIECILFEAYCIYVWGRSLSLVNILIL